MAQESDAEDIGLSLDGRPWWKPRNWPGRNRPMGGTHRIAAFLWFNKNVNDQFTMREIREALGDDDSADTAEQLNRRLRELRKHGWRFDSYKNREGQATDSYRLLAKGKRMWLGEKNRVAEISAAVRRQVLDRDGRRCVVCGVGAGEPYGGEPGSHARMTVGHRRAGARIEDASPDNLQAECSRCNEPVGDVVPDPEVAAAVMAEILKLGARDRRELRNWLDSGRRHRAKVDIVFDRARALSESERAEIVFRLDDTLKGGVT